MATAPMSTDTSARLSFAMVAASAGKDNVVPGPVFKTGNSVPARENAQENVSIDTTNHSSKIHGSKPERNIHTEKERSSANKTIDNSLDEARLIDAVKALNVSPMPSLVVNGSGVPRPRGKLDVIESFSEDTFQRGDSSSEVDTKPPSLDGKSITSGTTFALDEKESLRPDDSASVKFAEDDDTSSQRGSIVAGSRIGSEAARRAYRAEFPDGRSILQMQDRQGQQGAITPQSTLQSLSSDQTTDDGKAKPLVGVGPEGFSLFYRHPPDEKLLEALESPKDRIFLLRLEQAVIEFVRSSKEPFIDFPPSNSFCRMLTHKLADYYHMTHQVDPDAGSVRIFRTPFCRLPAILTSISNPPTTGNTPPPTMPMMKIMRRGGEGDTGLSPSKATSEEGSDGKDKSLSAKEKLSREEREAAYLRARERIFGKDDKSGDATPDTEDGNEMSRSSSVSTKDRASQSKRPKQPKQRRDDSESFDVRSQYTPFFPQPQQPTWVPGPTYPNTYSGTAPSPYQVSINPHFTSSPSFNPALVPNTNMQAYNSMQYQQPNQQRYQPPSPAMSGYGLQGPTPPMVQQQQWPQPNMYQGQYMMDPGPMVSQIPMVAQAPMVNQGPMSNGAMINGLSSSIPYAFGQLPSTANPADPKSQHPIPGSFPNRRAFNPKTQSFVPGNGGPQIPPPLSHHGSPHHGSPHHGSPHIAYNAFTPPNTMGYNMARQGSNNSLPGYHVSPHMAHRPLMHQGISHTGGPGMPANLPQNVQLPQLGQLGLPHYGNPATLPPKPPAGI